MTRILVPIKQVPDPVEELEIRPDGTDLDRDWLTFVTNEFDEFALEEALLLKDERGAEVTVVAVDTTGQVDNALYTALARGADRAVKIGGDFEGRAVDNHVLAAVLARAIEGMEVDLILTGVQAADDWDGQLGVHLASRLGLPHVSVVASVQLAGDGRTVLVRQEYSGGAVAELEVDLPAVLGIQVSRQPPRYAPVSRVRQAMKEAEIEEVEAERAEVAHATVRQLVRQESAGRAEMIDGSPHEVADRILELLSARGLVRR